MLGGSGCWQRQWLAVPSRLDLTGKGNIAGKAVRLPEDEAISLCDISRRDETQVELGKWIFR